MKKSFLALSAFILLGACSFAPDFDSDFVKAVAGKTVYSDSAGNTESNNYGAFDSRGNLEYKSSSSYDCRFIFSTDSTSAIYAYTSTSSIPTSYSYKYFLVDNGDFYKIVRLSASYMNRIQTGENSFTQTSESVNYAIRNTLLKEATYEEYEDDMSTLGYIKK